MNEEVKKEKFSKLSLISVISGSLAGIYSAATWVSILFILSGSTTDVLEDWVYIIGCTFVIVLFAILTAVTCGSIDLSNIKRGYSSKRSKKLDITGIILGILPIPAYVVLTYLTSLYDIIQI